ncbi:uncharacterized protein LOC119219031 [Pungitius pungitius]|uniref:uncharacterized protein LOC119219031 n=1 Tax=Pungitius pungitius TaxID=134920 RepID=UPI002E0DE1BE
MSFGFCVRMLLFSILAFGHNANALGYRSRSATGVHPLFGNPKKPPQPNSNGIFLTQAESWVSSQNGKSIESGIASSGEIIMQSGPQPSKPQQPYYQHQPSTFQPKKPSPQNPTTFNSGDEQNWLRPQQQPTFNQHYRPPRPGSPQLPAFNPTYQPTPQEPTTFNSGYLQNWQRPQQQSTFDEGYWPRPPRPQQPPNFNPVYPQQKPKPNSLKTH